MRHMVNRRLWHGQLAKSCRNRWKRRIRTSSTFSCSSWTTAGRFVEESLPVKIPGRCARRPLRQADWLQGPCGVLRQHHGILIWNTKKNRMWTWQILSQYVTWIIQEYKKQIPLWYIEMISCQMWCDFSWFFMKNFMKNIIPLKMPSLKQIPIHHVPRWKIQSQRGHHDVEHRQPLRLQERRRHLGAWLPLRGVFQSGWKSGWKDWKGKLTMKTTNGTWLKRMVYSLGLGFRHDICKDMKQWFYRCFIMYVNLCLQEDGFDTYAKVKEAVDEEHSLGQTSTDILLYWEMHECHKGS